MFAALSENGQAHIAPACEFSIFPARPCCRRNKEKERKQSNARKSYERDRQLKCRRLPEKQNAKPENFSGGLHFLVK